MQHKNEQLMVKICDYALDYYRKNNVMPSTRTIAEGVGTNRGTVQKYLVEMNERGMISYDGQIRRIHSFSTAAGATGTNNAGLIGSISCGIPTDAEEHVEAYIPLPVSIFGNGQLYILRADGDSMTNAGIDDGDLVVVRKTQEAHDGDIVVALTEETGTTLKRLYHQKETGRVILHPENDAMADMYFESIEIQGVAVKIIKTV